MLRREFRLSRDALVRVIRRENLGEPHPVLSGAQVWLDEADEHAADRRARAELSRIGALDRDGRLASDFHDALAVVARPKVEFYGWVARADSNFALLAASTGRAGVLLVHEDRDVLIAPAHADALPEALIARLPEFPPARGHSITAPESEFRLRPPTPKDGFGTFRQPKSAIPAKELRRLVEQPRYGGGQVYAAGREAGSRRCRALALTYLDTESGRWMTYVDTRGPADRWIVAAPAGVQAMAGRVRTVGRSLG
ncbi:ESX secretion-associated protein EspG [Actinokineospora sp.]|uniref:ESX secretion-associated protein EspG n=1 Tax=Actinokineospora sp. TaxID=1872133 RepID=UPI0040382918